MKKSLKFIIPVILLVAVFGTVIYASSASRWNIRTSEGLQASKGVFTLAKHDKLTFVLYRGDLQIASDNAEYEVAWSSSDPIALYIDPATGEAEADKDGAMPVASGEVTLSATITERASGVVTVRSYTVLITEASFELITTISGVHDGLSLEANTEYSLIAMTYDRKDNELQLSSRQLFCTFTCDRLTIENGKFTATERGTYTIVTTGYESQEDLEAGVNPVIKDVLEIYVYADPTPTPEPSPEPVETTPEPEANPEQST